MTPLQKEFPVVAPRKGAYLALEGTTHYNNIRPISRWVHDELGYYGSRRFFASNQESFRRLFGRPTDKFRGDGVFDVWIFENGFALLTALDKGTSFEVPQDTSLEDAQRFIKTVLDALTQLDAEIYQAGVAVLTRFIDEKKLTDETEMAEGCGNVVIDNIVVAPKKRQRGYATQFLQALKDAKIPVDISLPKEKSLPFWRKMYKRKLIPFPPDNYTTWESA